jgi:hypothetical protein
MQFASEVRQMSQFEQHVSGIHIETIQHVSVDKQHYGLHRRLAFRLEVEQLQEHIDIVRDVLSVPGDKHHRLVECRRWCQSNAIIKPNRISLLELVWFGQYKATHSQSESEGEPHQISQSDNDQANNRARARLVNERHRLPEIRHETLLPAFAHFELVKQPAGRDQFE